MCLNPLLISVNDIAKSLDVNASAKVNVHTNFVKYLSESGDPKDAIGLLSSRPTLRQYFLAPCRRCQDCLVSRSVDIGIRCHYESLVHDKNCFVTLTYDAEHVGDYRLCYDHITKFLKKLRRHADYHYGIKNIRYAVTGEYGDKKGRPHWHLLLFGFDPFDKVRVPTTSGVRFTSPTLSKLWGKGHVDVDLCTANSCFYTARYCQKKWRAEDDHHFKRYSKSEQYVRKQRREIFHCSKGLGKEFFLRMLPHLQREFVVTIPMMTRRLGTIHRRKFPVPSYFRRLLKIALSDLPQFQSKYYREIRSRILKLWDLSSLSMFISKLSDLAKSLLVNFDLSRVFRRRSELMIRSRLGNAYRFLDNTS